MQLSPRLLLAASKLRALAVDGAVEAPAAELARTLGASTRTLRTVLGELAHGKALSFESGRGPGALVRVVFTGEKQKEKRKEAEEAEGKAEEAETGRGRGGAAHLNGATREVPQQQASSPAPKKRKEGEGEAEEAEGRLTIGLTPELLSLLTGLVDLAHVALRKPGMTQRSSQPSVSDREATCSECSKAASGPISHRVLKPDKSPVVGAPQSTPSSSSPHGSEPASASVTPTAPATSRPAPPSSPGPKESSVDAAAGEQRPTAEEIDEAVNFRADQQRPHGFKKTEAAFKRDLTRKFKGDRWREVREILDEKRELAEVKGRTSSVALAPPAIPAAPAFTLEQLRERERRKDAEATKQRIQESAAARRTVST